MGCFDTGKLSDSGTEKRLRNGPFAENARGRPLVQIELTLERSTPDNLPAVACGVLKPSAQQQGVQEQRHDGVLGGPRCPAKNIWDFTMKIFFRKNQKSVTVVTPGIEFQV